MQAVVIDKPGDVSVGELPDPVPQPEEVVVAVRSCGMCGTDLHIFDGEFSLARYPIVPGHEFAGEVVAVGSAVSELSVGAYVSVDPNHQCGTCRPCLEGHGNLCLRLRATGVNVQGASAEFVAVPWWLARTVPAGLDPAVAALVEPLSCAVHGYDLLRARLGERLVIYGAGTMGLLMLALAPRSGAVAVTVVEPNPSRRALAASFGATRAVADDDELGGERFDVVIDASGALGAIEAALVRVKPAGSYLQFGVAPAGGQASFSPYRLYSDEMRFVGSMAVLHSFDRARDLAAELDLGLERLVSHSLPLADYASALEQMRAGEGLKLQVVPSMAKAKR